MRQFLNFEVSVLQSFVDIATRSDKAEVRKKVITARRRIISGGLGLVLSKVFKFLVLSTNTVHTLKGFISSTVLNQTVLNARRRV